MKKTIAFLVALCLCLSSGMVAFADDMELVKKSEAVYNEMQNIVDYLGKEGYMVKNSYTVDDAVNLYYLTESSYKEIELENTESFVADVKANVTANDGKLVSSFGENMATYAATIDVLYHFGEKPSDICGYNLYDAFYAMDPTELPSSPYFYNLIIPVAASGDDKEFAKKVCDTLVDNYYVKGKGMDYYGLSCDNTAYLISALSAYSNPYEETGRYKEVIADCLKVLQSYKVEGGYCFNPDYGTDPNGDSTALALMAYSKCWRNITWDTNEDLVALADEAYDDLQSFKGTEGGAYTYMKDGDNVYASADVLRALEPYGYMLALLSIDDEITENDNPSEDINEPATDVAATMPSEAPASASYPKSPATGDNAFAIAFGIAICAAALAVTLKKKSKS